MVPLVAPQRRLLLGTAMALSLLGCADDPEVCAAVMSYSDSVITVSEVLDHTGERVDRIRLTTVELDGRSLVDDLLSDVAQDRPLDPGTGSSDTGRYHGLATGPGGELVCTVPCGFGTEPGDYRLEVTSARGGRATLEVTAGYRGQGEGCGGALEGGAEVELELDPPG